MKLETKLLMGLLPGMISDLKFTNNNSTVALNATININYDGKIVLEPFTNSLSNKGDNEKVKNEKRGLLYATLVDHIFNLLANLEKSKNNPIISESTEIDDLGKEFLYGQVAIMNLYQNLNSLDIQFLLFEDEFTLLVNKLHEFDNKLVAQKESYAWGCCCKEAE